MKNRKILLLFLLTLALAFAMVAGAGCAPSDPPQHTHTFAEGWTFNDSEHWHAATCGHSSERDSVAPHDIDGDGKCTVCDYETAPAPEKMTFEQLVADHKEELNEFVTEAIAPSVLANKEILSESRYVASAEDGNLGTVSLLYIYKNDETVRTMELAEVTLTSTVTNVDIANGTFATPAVSVEKTEVFQFDAKENFEKQDVAELLYKAANCESAEVKLFRELEADSVKIRSFAILVQSDGFVRIKNVNVEVTDDTDEALKTNLADSNKYDAHVAVSEVALKGTNILAGDYRLEEFEVAPDNPDTPSAITDKQLIAALEQYCKDNLLNRLSTKTLIEDDYGSFDKSKMYNEHWYLNENENEEITKIEYSFFFAAASNDGRFVLASFTFDTPVSKGNLVEGILPRITYKGEEYILGYNPSIQTERSALANAILTVCKGAPADSNSTVILEDNGMTVDNSLGGDGHVNQFIVVEISESGAKEYRVKIRHATGDAQCIQYIADGYWAQTATREYKITGRRLVAEESDTIIDKQILDALESNYKERIFEETMWALPNADMTDMSEMKWYVQTNDNGDITKVVCTFVYEKSNLSAFYKIVAVNLDTPCSKNNLIKGDLPAVTLKEEYSLNYDPSIQTERSALANAILTACKGAPADSNSTVILVDNHTSTNAQFGIVGGFTIIEVTENGAMEYQIIIKYALDDNAYIQEIEKGNYKVTVTVREHKITGRRLVAEESDTIIDKQILDALESNYMQGIMKKTLIGQTINTENVTNINWYLEDNNDDDLIEKVYFSCFYERTKTSAYYLVGSATFDTSISREDLIKGDVLNVTYAKEYVLNYDPSIQTERSELANAILTACKGAPADSNSTIILVDNRTSTNAQFGTVGKFTIIDVTENGAMEYQIKIKYSLDDNAYIQEIEKGNYEVTVTAREHKITGRRLVAEE